MQTVGEFIHSITHQYNKGVASDDSRLLPPRVFMWLITARAKLLADKLNKRKEVSDAMYTTHGCVPLEKTTAHDCSCLPSFGCYYYRTKCKLPSYISSSSNPMHLKNVSSLDGSIKFDLVKETFLEESRDDDYFDASEKMFIRNNYIYLVTNTNDLEAISLKLLQIDFTESMCSVCDANPFTGKITETPEECTSIYDQTFEIDSDLSDRLLTYVTNKVREFQTGVEDITNNNSDSTFDIAK